MSLPLNKYAKNVHSQNGEDGIIEEILNRLSIHDSEWCVEFGAWDGLHLSNTFSLVEKGWDAVFIEGEITRYKDLLATVKQQPSIVPINAFVAREPDDENSLDNLLKKTPIPKEFCLLSIDIDSYDLDIWECLNDYSAKIVIIEINSSVPPGIIWRHSKKTQGNTFSATLNVSIRKGYTLVCHTGNMIFVRNDLIDMLNIDTRYINYPELLFLYDSPALDRLNSLFTLGLVGYIPSFLRPYARKLRAIFRI